MFTVPIKEAHPLAHAAAFYSYEVYQDGAAGWGWLARYNGHVLVLSTGHSGRQACEDDIRKFKRSTIE